MTTEQSDTALTERLSHYRTTLDDAIIHDLESRSRSTGARTPRNRRMLRGAAALLLIAGVAALGWSSLGSNTSQPMTSDEQVFSTAPAQTEAPDTTETTETTLSTIALSVAAPVPNATIQRLAVGDQVMLGAAAELAASGWTVDAVESRSPTDTFNLLERLRDAGRLGDTVVLHTGTNGPISAEELEMAMATLADLPDVRVLTVALDRSYAVENNDLIRRLPDRFANVSVIDWAVLAAQCPGDCFYSDGLHVRPDGQRFYTELIDASTGD